MSDPISALQDQLQEACDALGDMPREIERLQAENERRDDRIKQLMVAIEEHRLDVWGTGPIGRDRDAELYAVLESEVSDE